MNFLNIFNTLSQQKDTTLGENGTPQLTAESVGDMRLVLFTGLGRDTPILKLSTLLQQYIDSMTEDNICEMLCDLFVITFYKRDCRGGEGEKKLFYTLLGSLYDDYPKIVQSLLHLIPYYGSWKDMWLLASSIPNEEFIQTIYTICSDQLLKDKTASNEDITLCAKWSPNERTEIYTKLYSSFQDYLKMIFPDSTTLEKDYRILLKTLREKTNIVEQLMCSGRYADIDPKKTPSICANKNRKAFLNISKDAEKKMEKEQWETGNRFPSNPDRVLGRQRWLKAVKEGTVKGGQLNPCDLVDSLSDITDESEIALIDAQWNDLVLRMRQKIAIAVESGYEPTDNIIPMIDLSPSMGGRCYGGNDKYTPMSSAIGLGIMLSELCDPTYGNMVITFDSDPHVVTLDRSLPFSERVKLVHAIPTGYATDFSKAMKCLGNIVLEKQLSQENLPSICILTDEQMDQQRNMFGYSPTADETIKIMFEQIGRTISGEPYTRPRTIHWNLRSDTEGYPVKAHENNVQSVSGYSPSILDLILCGKPEPNPYETMRRRLDDERYDQIREIVKTELSREVL